MVAFVVTRPADQEMAGAEAELRTGNLQDGTVVHLIDQAGQKAQCETFGQDLLPTFRRWSGPMPAWSSRCRACLALVPAKSDEIFRAPRLATARHIWTWGGTMGSVGSTMTVTADGVTYRLFGHLHLRRRFLPWVEIEGFAPRYTRFGPDPHQRTKYWFPELVPKEGRARRPRAIPTVLLHSREDAQRASEMVNRALRLDLC